MCKASVYDCLLINLGKITSRQGNITIVERQNKLPFIPSRIFYLYDIPGGASRGAHAHKKCHQFLIAASGAFEVLLDDANIQRSVQLNRPDMGLYIPPTIWASEINFSSGSICLVLASHFYDEDDYLRDYNYYRAWKLG
jgi:hypothetical protein